MKCAPVPIVLSGATGKMVTEIAGLALEPANLGLFRLAPFVLASEKRRGEQHPLGPDYRPTFITPEELPAALDQHRMHDAIVIDYTTPEAALDNIRCYIGADVSFVMGTTGFDREEAVRMVRASSVNAVIAPNMAAPIVALQSMLAQAAAEFPGVLDGWHLAIMESHQRTKRDVSGTARAIQPLLEKLGAGGMDGITAVRNPEEQLDLGVPPDALAGHGWHWYRMQSPAGDAAIDFSHRVVGRRIYAEGTLRAARFLSDRTASVHGQVYSMIEVLRAPMP